MIVFYRVWNQILERQLYFLRRVSYVSTIGDQSYYLLVVDFLWGTYFS
jgi:hypothetical protein